jgi:hypothetical protein
MKKVIIYLLILSLLVNNFAKAEPLPLPIDKVPVIDTNIINVIGQLKKLATDLELLLITISELSKQTNVLSSKILETRFQQMSADLVGDISKAQQYIKNLSEMEVFLEERRNKVKDQNTYSEALQEAKTAGAYLGLQDFINSLSCVNPAIRDELTDYLKDLNREFNLPLKAEELLNNIPDCSSETTNQIILKPPSFFAWLTQPFKLNLAQINPPAPGEEIPPITITSALQETENSIELSNLKNISASLIRSRAKEKEEERKKEIGEIWPVEKCSKEIVDENIAGGIPICLKYSTLISGKDIEQLKQQLSLNNPLNNPSQSMEFFQSLIPSSLSQIGITTSSISTPSKILENLKYEREIKKLINKKCASYKVGPPERGEAEDLEVPEDIENPSILLGKIQTGYIACVQQLWEQFTQLTESLKKDIEDRMNRAIVNKNVIEALKIKAELLKSRIDPNVCPGASKDLEKIITLLQGKGGIYLETMGKLAQFSVSLTALTNSISLFRSRIFTSLDEAFSKLRDILPFLNFSIDRFIKELISGILDDLKSFLSTKIGEIPLPIIHDIKIGPLKFSKDQILGKLRVALNELNLALGPVANFVVTYNETIDELYSSKLTNSSFINDSYELDLIAQKLEAYERAIERGECLPKNGYSGGVSLIKNQVIVVENKKEKNKSFNLFASLKNMFAPKIVEISNEK